MWSGFDSESATLVEVLERRAELDGARLAHSFLPDGDQACVHVTYRELDERARAIAGLIRAYGGERARALLVYPTGVEFVAAFFGCLYAGVVAVPVYPPDPLRFEPALARLALIARDAEAKLVLTTVGLARAVDGLGERVGELRRLRWLATDAIDGDGGSFWREPHSSGPRVLALLQYTSGSTGTPKGVMLTHSNLMEHGKVCHRILRSDQREVMVSWLPLYHDMGLIGSVVYPQQAGYRSVLMSPDGFLRRPYSWLRAISDNAGTLSVAPNFAYELCARRITPDQAKTLDLSEWTAALNGSERVRKDTMERFARAFEVSGFRKDAFMPCYGLAEATLMVSAGPRAAAVTSIGASREALSKNSLLRAEVTDSGAEEMVGCGAVQLGQRVEIVNPGSGARAAEDEVGEIWVSGPCVAQGYWNKPDQTSRTFNAHLAGTGEGPFLRTGDLGFIHDGQLFVTGRMKDVIIVRGQNHYPEDIEHTAGASHCDLRPGGGAAFSVDGASEEHLVVLHEVKTGHVDTQAVVESICAAVAVRHRLRVDCVVLLRARTTPKTSSGKVRRHLCRKQFLEGALDAIGEWRSSAMIDDVCTGSGKHDGGTTGDDGSGMQAAKLDGDRIKHWLVARFAELRGLLPSQVDVKKEVAAYGLDSAEAAMLAADLEQWLGVELPARVVWDSPTIDALASALVRYLRAEVLAGTALVTVPQTAETERSAARGE